MYNVVRPSNPDLLSLGLNPRQSTRGVTDVTSLADMHVRHSTYYYDHNLAVKTTLFSLGSLQFRIVF
jgi:hypothetical protein